MIDISPHGFQYGFQMARPTAWVTMPHPLPKVDHWYAPGYGLLGTYSTITCDDMFLWQDIDAHRMRTATMPKSVHRINIDGRSQLRNVVVAEMTQKSTTNKRGAF